MRTMSEGHRGLRVLRTIRTIANTLLTCILFFGVSAQGQTLDYLEGIPPGQKYKSLKILMNISKGNNRELIQFTGIEAYSNTLNKNAGVMIDEVSNPIARLADPNSLASTGLQLVVLAQHLAVYAQAEIDKITSKHPDLVEMFDEGQLLEESIIIRTMISHSIERKFSQIDINKEQLKRYIASFNHETSVLTDEYEMVYFSADIDALTAETLEEFGATLAAHQRLVDSEVDKDSVRLGLQNLKIMNQEARSSYEKLTRERSSQIIKTFSPLIQDPRLRYQYCGISPAYCYQANDYN